VVLFFNVGSTQFEYAVLVQLTMLFVSSEIFVTVLLNVGNFSSSYTQVYPRTLLSSLLFSNTKMNHVCETQK